MIVKAHEDHYWEPEKKKRSYSWSYLITPPTITFRKNLMLDEDANETPEEYLIRMAPITYILYRCPEERINHPDICDLTDQEIEDYKQYVRSVIAAPLWEEVILRARRKGLSDTTHDFGGIHERLMGLVEKKLYKFNNPEQNKGRRVQNFHYFVQYDVRTAFKKDKLENEAISEHVWTIRKRIEKYRQQAMILLDMDYDEVTPEAIYKMQPQGEKNKLSKKVIKKQMNEQTVRFVEWSPELAYTQVINRETDPLSRIWKHKKYELIEELLSAMPPVERYILEHFKDLKMTDYIRWLMASPEFNEICMKDKNVKKRMKRRRKKEREGVITQNFVTWHVNNMLVIVRKFMKKHDLYAQDMEGIIGYFIDQDKNDDEE